LSARRLEYRRRSPFCQQPNISSTLPDPDALTGSLLVADRLSGYRIGMTTKRDIAGETIWAAELTDDELERRAAG